jgi:hypothetical protein
LQSELCARFSCIHAPFVNVFHIVLWHTLVIVAAALPDLDQLDIDALKALVIEQRESLDSHTQQVEHLKLVIEKLRRMIFGAKSEKIIVQVEQFELQLGEAETEQASAKQGMEAPVSEAKPSSNSRPSRKPGSPATGLRRWGGSRGLHIFRARL